MAITIPQLLSNDPVFNRYQTLLKSALQPLANSTIALATPVTTSVIVNGVTTSSPNITLLAASNPNVVQLGPILSGPLQGWVLTRIKGQATIWDSQDSNTTPQKTLLLNTSADVVVNLLVF